MFLCASQKKIKNYISIEYLKHAYKILHKMVKIKIEKC